MLLGLIAEGQSRGTNGWTLTTLKFADMCEFTVYSSYNEFDEAEYIDALRSCPIHDYAIVHLVSSTGKTKNLHPASANAASVGINLWHNGIIRSYKPDVWDTQQLATDIAETDDILSTLATTEGSFACLAIMKPADGILAFRNTAAPLYHSYRTHQFCSVRAPGFQEISPNILWALDPKSGRIDNRGSFENLEEPFYFVE